MAYSILVLWPRTETPAAEGPPVNSWEAAFQSYPPPASHHLLDYSRNRDGVTYITEAWLTATFSWNIWYP